MRPILNEQIDKATYLMTDDAAVYPAIGRDYSGHGTVNHSIKEYVRGTFWIIRGVKFVNGERQDRAAA